LKASRSEESFRKWLEDWVLSVKDHAGYLDKLGRDRLERLRAHPDYGYNPVLERKVDVS
ncbi:MAG: glutaconate CoA-transferase, partial [Clostridia bacterium]|nr:glutaconate CoA-transferase [Clostridia bacterium]